MHVRGQIVLAVVQRLARDIPELQGRVYPVSALAWDRRSYPYAIVAGLDSSSAVEDGTDGRIQRRRLSVGVEIRDIETEGADYAERVDEIAVAVEAAMDNLDEDVPVEDVECTGDSGVVEMKPDDEHEYGVRVGTGIAFDVTFYTERGRADAFISPND